MRAHAWRSVAGLCLHVEAAVNFERCRVELAQALGLDGEILHDLSWEELLAAVRANTTFVSRVNQLVDENR